MTTDTDTLDRIDRVRANAQRERDALRAKLNAMEIKMVEMSGAWSTWQAASEGRDKRQSASIKRVEASVELVNGNVTTFNESNQSAFESIQKDLRAIVGAQSNQEAVEKDRKERSTGPVPSSVIASAVAAGPASGVIPPGGASLAAARGWVQLVQSISPAYIVLMLVLLAFSGVTLTAVGLWWVVR